jgi:hypothetical protein
MEVKAPIPLIAMNAAAPGGAPPRRIMAAKKGKPPCPAVPRRGPEAGNLRKYSNFSWYGVNSHSSQFLQSRKKYKSVKKYSKILSNGSILR